VGASAETDLHIIKLTDSLYKGYGLKRVYYSGYIPVT
jgi:predicted DNA-binding helix-hairpin-helix protein